MKELMSIHSTAKSFHKKAHTETTKNGKKLFSYDMLVAEIIGKNAIVYNLKTDSTIRHVMEFLIQGGYKAENKKQIIEDYVRKV